MHPENHFHLNSAKLFHNYPNPLNPITVISYIIPLRNAEYNSTESLVTLKSIRNPWERSKNTREWNADVRQLWGEF
jgi:hypothetical protein